MGLISSFGFPVGCCGAVFFGLPTEPADQDRQPQYEHAPRHNGQQWMNLACGNKCHCARDAAPDETPNCEEASSENATGDGRFFWHVAVLRLEVAVQPFDIVLNGNPVYLRTQSIGRLSKVLQYLSERR